MAKIHDPKKYVTDPMGHKVLDARTELAQLRREIDRLVDSREAYEKTIADLELRLVHMSYEESAKQKRLDELTRQLNRVRAKLPPPDTRPEPPPSLDALLGPLAALRKREQESLREHLLTEPKAPPQPTAAQLEERRGWLSDLLTKLDSGHQQRAHYEERLRDVEHALRILSSK